MKRLPAAKRNQLIMVVLATIALVSGVYFLLISPQKNKIENIANSTRNEQDNLDRMKDIIRKGQDTASKLKDMSLQLNQAEEDLASGDVYEWTYETLRQFKANYHVEIPNVGQPSVGDVDVLADFPYKQVKISLDGTAFYHDLGKFLADFENNFPHMRLVNLSIQPAGNPGGTAEKLTFRVDIVALVKPNT
jgi:Tfp pilus assembly protein PilO